MKYAIKFEVDMTPEELAERCNKDRVCHLEQVDVPCPFMDKVCRDVTEDEWKNLEDEDVQ